MWSETIPGFATELMKSPSPLINYKREVGQPCLETVENEQCDFDLTSPNSGAH